MFDFESKDLLHCQFDFIIKVHVYSTNFILPISVFFLSFMLIEVFLLLNYIPGVYIAN